MKDKNIKKTHLIYGLLKTICGKHLESVYYTIDVSSCTCKTCLKLKHKDYPKR